MLSEKIQSFYQNSFVADYIDAAKSFNRWTYLFVLIVLTGVLIFYIDNVKYMDLELQALLNKKEQLRELKSANKQLYARYIELKNPERIDKLASETLGMVVPSEAPTRIIVKR